MSKGNTFETDLLDLIFTATAIANMADNAASAPLTNLYVALATAEYVEGDTADSSECAYTSYARVAVARTSGGWTVAAGACENAGAITFPQATGGSETGSHFCITVASSGASKILYKEALDSTLAISNGITPSFPAGDLNVTED